MLKAGGLRMVNMIEDKSTRFTLFATGILLLALLILGWGLSRTAAARKPPPPEAPPAVTPTPPAVPEAPPPPAGQADAPSLPLKADGQQIADLQVLLNGTLVEDPANDGDTYMISTPEGSHRFCLYFVDTVETDAGQPEAARDMAGYFEFDSEEPLREVGREAREFSLRLLNNSEFRVFTRWEANPAEQNSFYAFILLNDPEKGWTNLAQWLVRYGLARIVPAQQNLPDGTSAAQFLRLLEEEETRSRTGAHGAWSRKKP